MINRDEEPQEICMKTKPKTKQIVIYANLTRSLSPSLSSYGQRGAGGGGGGGYEAPACVQNAMMTKDKKPFTYTPGGIDLSQIRSERMAKRLARNAQAEGAATGAAQQNRPSPQSPGSGSPGSVASSMGAAAMGMPFQVLPPPPPPPQPQAQAQGKNGPNVAAPPPPPPQSTLAPPAGRGSAPGSPATARKSPTPQRFEPPPLGFRPEIKIPPNPMAALRKVPPPVEKNGFWKDEYCKERSKSPLPEAAAAPAPAAAPAAAQASAQNGNNNYNNSNSQDAVDGELRERDGEREGDREGERTLLRIMHHPFAGFGLLWFWVL